jgi:hypothetical protein
MVNALTQALQMLSTHNAHEVEYVSDMLARAGSPVDAATRRKVCNAVRNKKR